MLFNEEEVAFAKNIKLLNTSTETNNVDVNVLTIDNDKLIKKIKLGSAAFSNNDDFINSTSPAASITNEQIISWDNHEDLTATNFGAFTTSVENKNVQDDNDVLAYVDAATNTWVKQTFLNLVNYLKGFFQTARITTTSDITATNGNIYDNSGNNTYTDPTGVANKGYWVYNFNGVVTIDGVKYGSNTLIIRMFTGSVWKTDVLVSSKNQIEFSGNATVDETWWGKEITCMTSGELTIPASLPNEFNFTLRAEIGVTMTWSTTAPHTWRVNNMAVGDAPPSMLSGDYCQVSKRKGTNEIRITGL